MRNRLRVPTNSYGGWPWQPQKSYCPKCGTLQSLMIGRPYVCSRLYADLKRVRGRGRNKGGPPSAHPEGRVSMHLINGAFAMSYGAPGDGPRTAVVNPVPVRSSRFNTVPINWQETAE